MSSSFFYALAQSRGAPFSFSEIMHPVATKHSIDTNNTVLVRFVYFMLILLFSVTVFTKHISRLGSYHYVIIPDFKKFPPECPMIIFLHN